MTLHLEECSDNLKRYLRLYKKYKNSVDDAEQDTLLSKMEEIYFLLDDDETTFLESHGLC
jgi:hypothetical protein